MAPFAHWVTPEGSPKRFDTHFRLCWAATELTAISDGRETVAVEWLRPLDAIALGASNRRNLLFPTKCQLDLLAQSSTVDEAVTAARGRRIVPVSPSLRDGPTACSFDPARLRLSCAGVFRPHARASVIPRNFCTGGSWLTSNGA